MTHKKPSASPEANHVRRMALATKSGPIASVLATPAGPWTSAVVLIADNDGLDESMDTACRRLAANGHGALAIQLPFAQVDGDAERSDLRPLTQAVASALSFLRSSAPTPLARTGVIGYGTGGFVALAAAYRCQVGVAVSLYGKGPRLLRKNLGHVVDLPRRHASILCLIGGADEDVCPDDLKAIRGQLGLFEMRHTFVVYPRTKAGFCHPESSNYRENEAQDAWSKILRALEAAPRLRHRFASHAPPVAATTTQESAVPLAVG